jgi:hypothetical protein
MIIPKVFLKLSYYIVAFSQLVFTSISFAAYTVDPLSEFLITKADSSDYYPSIYGNIVAWRTHGAGNYGIFYKNLNSGQQYQISDSNIMHGNPSVYKEKIVWANHDRGSGNDGIYIHEISSGITTQVVSDPPDANPSNAKIYGSTIIWHGNHGGTPNILSGFDLITKDIYEISRGYNLSSVDIYQSTVAWGWASSIWAKNLTTGEVQGPIDPSFEESGDSWWPYGVNLYDDLVVWQSQFIDDSNELKTWGIFGAYLSTGEVIKINADPSYHSTIISGDLYGNIIVWLKRPDGPSDTTELWATNLTSGESFMISDSNSYGGASIYDDIVVYSKDGSIYGNFIIEVVPIPSAIWIFGSGLIGIIGLRRIQL